MAKRRIQVLGDGAIIWPGNQYAMLESSYERFNGSANSCDGFIHCFLYDDIADNSAFKDVIHEIIEKGYQNLGGTRTPVNDMFNDPESRYSVFSTSADQENYDAFCSVAIHKVHLGCPKLRCIAGREPLKSQGVYALIEYEIARDGYCCLAEVSGAIEHIYAKSNGYVVPNIYAKKLLRLTNSQFAIDQGDPFHYDHIYEDGRRFRKVLYGFRHRKYYDLITKRIEDNANTWDECGDYESFRKKANLAISQLAQLNESAQTNLDEYEIYELFDIAAEFLDRIGEMQHYDKYNEFPEQIFRKAEFMLYVTQKLGNTYEYEECKKTHSRWLTKVSKFELITL